MSFVTPSPECCARPCPSPLVENIPGVQGPPGANGTNGTNGRDSFTATTADFTMPAEGAQVTVDVLESRWAVIGQYVFVGKLASAVSGTFIVNQVPDALHLVLTNAANTGAGLYTGNSAPGSVFPSASAVGPAGQQGTTGSAPAGVFLVANNLSEGVLATKQSNLGIGTAGTRADNFFFQVANNLNEGVPATMRTSLQLKTAALLDAGVTNTKLPPIDTTFTNGDSVWATASGLQTKSAANARLALGIGGGIVGNYVLCQDIHASNSVPPAFNNAVPVQVPLNTKKADTGSIATLVGNVLTLPVGTYRVRASVPGFQCGIFQALLWNTFNNVLEFMGSVGSSDALSTTTGWSFVNGLLVVAGSSKTYELRAQCVTPGSFGAQCAFGDEVYASLELEQQS